MSIRLKSKEEFEKYLEETFSNLECTCKDCLDSDDCEYAFDAYNTHGDCLAIK